MRRIHLFEFEDFSWFPSSLRDCMTQMLIVVHRIFGTSKDLTGVVQRVLHESGQTKIIDLCSGSGGPMPEIVRTLRATKGLGDLRLELTDLYPLDNAAAQFGEQAQTGISYRTTPVDATNVGDVAGVRTLICGFHHMRPEVARQILQNAQQSGQPICILEISDNSVPPPWLFWIGLPLNFLFGLVVSVMVRPMTARQVVFTWLIPILPICFAWDGAVSNVRTYSLSDLDQLLWGLEADNYRWEKGLIEGKLGNKIYLLGFPDSSSPLAM